MTTPIAQACVMVTLLLFSGWAIEATTKRQYYIAPETRFSGKVKKDPGVFLSIDSHDVIHCNLLCIKYQECMAFYMDYNERRCHLTSVVTLNDRTSSEETGVVYYRLRQVSVACPGELGYVYNRALKLCYRMNDVGTNANWTVARDVCRTEGGDLISLHTDQQVNHLGHMMETSSGDDSLAYFTGAQESAGKWVWPDGSPVSPGLWCEPGPPSPSQQSATLQVLEGAATVSFCLTAIPVIHNLNFICQLPSNL